VAKPVILAIDDDRGVLHAVQADLRRQYGKDYRVMAADSGRTALEALDKLKLRNTPVALLLSDQRMPDMTGVEFLEQSIERYPDAKRALLTAYADTEAAIRAINQARVDHYLTKPWDPPEERLYPVLDDLLETWAPPPPVADLRVIGHRWSREAHAAKDFLARNLVPYQWLDVEKDDEARKLLELAGVDASKLPVVLFGDGSALVRPSNADLAERVGLRTKAQLEFYDLLVVGGGPAGLAAAVYGASEGLRTLLVEQVAPGGQAGMSSRIENYLGFPKGLSGSDLAHRALIQATRFGAEILTPQEAVGLRVQDTYRLVTLADGSEVGCRALVIATGVSYRTLDIPGADQLLGMGVYYSAARPEALAHQGEDVFIIGGGNSAGQAAMFLSLFCRSVTILVRSESLAASMSQYLIDQIEGTPNITVRYNTEVSEVKGNERVETLTLTDTQSAQTETVSAGALFVFVGAVPRTDWVGDVVERDRYGYIISGWDHGERPRGWSVERPPLALEASLPGVFVAGDVRFGSVKRVASAVGEGAMAVRFVHEHLATS
jgi:thioredoxin reductase (NADPH)